MYGERWARFKARWNCDHEWVADKGYRVSRISGTDGQGLLTNQTNLFVYRCSKCGKKKREYEEPRQGEPW
jgi:hypothetical protein